MGILNLIIIGSVVLAVFLAILFRVSPVGKYYTKLTFFSVAPLIYTAALIPTMLIKPRNTRNALIPAALMRWSCRLLGIRYKARGLENIDNSRGCVVVLNHQSVLDILAMAILWPYLERCRAISKKSLLYVVPFGPACWLWGTIFIDRGAQSARNAMNMQAETLKNDKSKIFVYPEGTRNTEDTLLPFRKGAFHVAVNAGVPVQPIVVSKQYFFSAKEKRFDGGEYIVTVLPLIETVGMDERDLPLLVEKTRNKMQEVFAETRLPAKTE